MKNVIVLFPKIIIILYFFSFIYIYGQEMPVPVSLQGKLIPKILILNRTFENKNPIRLGILYSKYLRNSSETMTEVKNQVLSSDVGKKIIIVTMEISGINDFKSYFSENNINALYIAPIRGYDQKDIKLACNDLDILTFTGDPELVDEYYTVGFDLIEEKPKIIINIKSASEEGVDFSSRLLKLAKVK